MQALLEADDFFGREPPREPLAVFKRNYADFLQKKTFSDLDDELFRLLQHPHLLE
jgi:hypothetical protein